MKPYIPLTKETGLCPTCGNPVSDVQVTMYPANKPDWAFLCARHGIWMEHELIAKENWPKREKFLASRAGTIDYLLPGDR